MYPLLLLLEVVERREVASFDLVRDLGLLPPFRNDDFLSLPTNRGVVVDVDAICDASSCRELLPGVTNPIVGAFSFFEVRFLRSLRCSLVSTVVVSSVNPNSVPRAAFSAVDGGCCLVSLSLSVGYK